MTMPAGAFANPPQRRSPGVVELNLGDEWRGIYVEGDELPEAVPALYGYTLVVRQDKGYVTRREDDERWGIVEAPFTEGETPEGWASRAAHEQTGAVVSRTFIVGYLDCKATRLNEEHPTGTRSIRPLMLAVAETMDDVPDESGFVRRRLPTNEYMTTVRLRYPELWKYLAKGLDAYLIMKARGEI